VAFGEITRQLGNVKGVLDALHPPDLSAISETVRNSKNAQGPAENAGATIVAQLQAMQKAVKPDEELVVLCSSGMETIRVLEVYAPSWQVIVLTGIDTERNITRVISHADRLQLTCKVMKAQTPEKPIRLGFITPKPKSE
jgi:hypothetical protein